MSVPSRPFDVIASPNPASNATPSTPAPTATSASTFPVAVSTTIIFWFLHPTKSRPWTGSIASPVGSSPGATDQCASTLFSLASISTTSFLSSTLTKTWPASSVAPNSSVPPTTSVSGAFSGAAGSTMVTSPLPWLKQKIFMLLGS